MKRKVKIPVIVISSVVAAVLIAVIVLCSITVRPLKSFMNYDTARVTTADYTLPSGATSSADAYRGKIDKNLKKTGFTVMHATLELVGSYGPKFEKVKDEDENEWVRNELTIDEARTAAAATENSYMLELEYAAVRTYKVGKEKIAYDRALMNVHTTDGELQWVTVYLYESRLDGAVNPEAQEYRITPVRLRMNLSPLYIALGEIAADYTV